MPPTAVRRVAVPTSAAASALLESREPLVLTGLVDSWPARQWTPAVLRREFGDAQICVRLHPRARASVWEGDCVQERASLGELCAWMDGSDSGRLSRYSRVDFVAYADYQDMAAVFSAADRERGALSSIDWSTVGVPRDGRQSTMWFGSEGAHTCVRFHFYINTIMWNTHMHTRT